MYELPFCPLSFVDNSECLAPGFSDLGVCLFSDLIPSSATDTRLDAAEKFGFAAILDEGDKRGFSGVQFRGDFISRRPAGLVHG